MSFSDQVAHERSQSSSRKSAASTVPTVIGCSVDGFWQRERDCVSETGVFSHSTRPRKLESRSVSTIDESMLKGKRDRGESIGQSMRDRENLHRILKKKPESANQGENEAQNFQRLKLMWKLEDGSKEVWKLPYVNPIENSHLKGYIFIKRIYGATMLIEKELICEENWE